MNAPTQNTQGGQPDSVWMGKTIDYPKGPLLGRLRARAVVTVLNALLRSTIITIQNGNQVPSANNRVTVAPNGGFIFQVDLTGATTPATPTTGGTASRFRLKSIQGDYLTCRTWDGVTEGTKDVLIARPTKYRCSIPNETIDGTLVTYTYNTNNVWRTAKASGFLDQFQQIFPTYSVNDEIWAMSVSPSLVLGGVISTDWIDMNVDNRGWAQVAQWL